MLPPRPRLRPKSLLFVGALGQRGPTIPSIRGFLKTGGFTTRPFRQERRYFDHENENVVGISVSLSGSDEPGVAHQSS